MYTNHDYDAVLGMYYAKARFYDAENRRFAAMDPVKGEITNPLTLTPYVYCVDNPLRWTDPLGLSIGRAGNVNLELTDTGAGHTSTPTKPAASQGPTNQVNTPEAKAPQAESDYDLFANPYQDWPEAVERAYSFASGFGWHTLDEHRNSGASWAIWDKTLQENVANQLKNIKNIYTDPALKHGIMFEQMIETQQTGGTVLDSAIEKRKNEVQDLSIEEIFQLLYLGLMYDEAQKLQQSTQLFAIYNGVGYAHNVVAPLFQQFPDYMDAAHVAMQGFSLGFNFGLHIGTLQAAAEAEYFKRLICYWAEQGTNVYPNSASQSVVLGRYNQDGVCYLDVAKEQGSTYFQLQNYDQLLDQYGPEFMWSVNEKFLEQQLAAGKTFILSHNPYSAAGSFAKEVQFLIDRGFSFVQSGSLWIAVK